MLDFNTRRYLTIESIVTSDEYDEHMELFDKGVEILKECEEGVEFSFDDREILEEIFCILDTGLE